MFSVRRVRPLMLAMAMLIMAAMFATNSQIAQAKCCEAIVKNESSCTVDALLITTSWTRRITLAPGTKTAYPITCGDDFSLAFLDICSDIPNDYRVYPYLGYFDVRISKTCCITVTGIPLEPCSVLITDSKCEYCP